MRVDQRDRQSRMIQGGSEEYQPAPSEFGKGSAGENKEIPVYETATVLLCEACVCASTIFRHGTSINITHGESARHAASVQLSNSKLHHSSQRVHE